MDSKTALSYVDQLGDYISECAFAFDALPDSPGKDRANHVLSCMSLVQDYLAQMNVAWNEMALAGEEADSYQKGLIHTGDDIAFLMANSLLLHPEDPAIPVAGIDISL